MSFPDLVQLLFSFWWWVVVFKTILKNIFSWSWSFRGAFELSIDPIWRPKYRNTVVCAYDSICAIMFLGLSTLGVSCGDLHETDGLHLPQRKYICLNWFNICLNSDSTFFWAWSWLWLNLLRSRHGLRLELAGLDYNTTLRPKVYWEEETTAMFSTRCWNIDAGICSHSYNLKNWTQKFLQL